MDHVDIPADQVLPMDAIADGVHGLRITFVNVFSVEHPDGSWTLIDAGLPMSEGTIRKWAEKRYQSAPNAIVLTHGHFDHVSAARELADHWGARVYAHEAEFPYLTGESEYPPPNVGAGGGIMSLLSPMYPRKPIDIGARLEPLPRGEDGVYYLDVMPGWRVLHTPGHTPGHVSFFRSEDATLIVGDAFCTTKAESFFEAALARQPELHGPPAYFTWDWKMARESVHRLADLNPRIVAPGHGKPLAGDGVAAALRVLAANFNEIAIPQNRHEH